MQKWQKTISKPNMALHHSQFRNSPSQANRHKGSLGDGPINLSDPSECIFTDFASGLFVCFQPNACDQLVSGNLKGFTPSLDHDPFTEHAAVHLQDEHINS
jgi:hypothetical protein